VATIGGIDYGDHLKKAMQR